MLRAQTSGKFSASRGFRQDDRNSRPASWGSNVSGASPGVSAAVGIQARTRTVTLACEKFITERPWQHKATSRTQVGTAPERGVAMAPRYMAKCRLCVSHLAKDFGDSSCAEPITRVDHPCPGPMLNRRHLASFGPAPPTRSRLALPLSRPVQQPLPC